MIPIRPATSYHTSANTTTIVPEPRPAQDPVREPWCRHVVEEPAKIGSVPPSVPAFATLMASTMVTVVVLVAVLVALGVALAVMGVHLVRATRTDPAALGPLEVMSERRWQRGDPEHRAEVLAGARPATAEAAVAAADAGHPEVAAAATVDAAADETVGEETTGDATVGEETNGGRDGRGRDSRGRDGRY